MPNLLQSISIKHRLKIYLSIIFYSTWKLLKLTTKWIFHPQHFNQNQQQDNPPECLVDSSFGQHKYIKLKGVKFHYVESGDPNNDLILLLHGFPDCWLSWRHQIPVLGEHFRVVALDLKGFGDSDKPNSRNLYKIQLVIEEMRQFIISMGVSRCVVVGHDIGALLGWYLAHQFPDLVTKFVAVSSAHPNIYNAQNVKFMSFVQIPYFPEVAIRGDLVKYHRHLHQGDTFLEAYKYAFCRQEDWSGALNYFRNFMFVEVAESTLNCPIMLVIGDGDGLVPLDSIVKSTYFCEKFQVKIIDNGGHFPHQEKYHQFNKILLKFLLVRNEVSSKGIMNRIMVNTVKYGNSVLGSVQKKTNGIVPSSFLRYTNIYERTNS